jgi:hypothetical protein
VNHQHSHPTRRGRQHLSSLLTDQVLAAGSTQGGSTRVGCSILDARVGIGTATTLTERSGARFTVLSAQRQPEADTAPLPQPGVADGSCPGSCRRHAHRRLRGVCRWGWKIASAARVSTFDHRRPHDRDNHELFLSNRQTAAAPASCRFELLDAVSVAGVSFRRVGPHAHQQPTSIVDAGVVLIALDLPVCRGRHVETGRRSRRLTAPRWVGRIRATADSSPPAPLDDRVLTPDAGRPRWRPDPGW